MLRSRALIYQSAARTSAHARLRRRASRTKRTSHDRSRVPTVAASCHPERSLARSAGHARALLAHARARPREALVEEEHSVNFVRRKSVWAALLAITTATA